MAQSQAVWQLIALYSVPDTAGVLVDDCSAIIHVDSTSPGQAAAQAQISLA